MTNQEAMSKLSPEEFYKRMHWLITNYAFQFTDSRLAIIEWLQKENKDA